MLQIISRKGFADVPPECGLISAVKVGGYNVSQFALSMTSLSSLKQLILSLVQGSSLSKLENFEKQFEETVHDSETDSYISIFVSNGSLAVFRRSSSVTSYPLFHVELCHKTLERMPPGTENEYSLRLGSLEPLLLFQNRGPCSHDARSSIDHKRISGYISLTAHASLIPLYFSSVVSLELYSTKPGANMNRPILIHKIPILEFIVQAEKTYVVPVNAAAEFRITYCGQHTLYHLCNLTRIPLTFPALSFTDSLPILGHRGCGSNKVHCKRRVPILENTPFSILTSHRMGCIGSELDVILTKDNVLVINHDFELEVITDTSMQSKINLPIPCMSYNEIVNLGNPRGIKATHNRCDLSSTAKQYGRSMSSPIIYTHDLYTETVLHKRYSQMHHKISMENLSKQGSNCPEEGQATYSVITEKMRVYTLAEVLSQCTDMTLNIEIKYPSKFSPYSAVYPSRLALVQTVLDTLAEGSRIDSSGSHTIFISSFDPIVCAIVKLLAPSIPVFLLFMGDNNTITPYMDVDLTAPSQLFPEDAVSFTKSIDLTGLVLWRNILDVQTGSTHLYECARQHNLTVLTYGTAVGEDTNDQKERGVTILICDLCHHQRAKRLNA